MRRRANSTNQTTLSALAMLLAITRWLRVNQPDLLAPVLGPGTEEIDRPFTIDPHLAVGLVCRQRFI